MSRQGFKKRRGARKRRGGRSVDQSVYDGVAQRLERMTADFNAANERLETLEGLLITVVAKAGGVINVGEVPPGSYQLEAEHIEGGVMLILTDDNGPVGQGGKDARDNAVSVVRSGDHLGNQRDDRQEDAGRC